jgi:hypothetical protein
MLARMDQSVLTGGPTAASRQPKQRYPGVGENQRIAVSDRDARPRSVIEQTTRRQGTDQRFPRGRVAGRYCEVERLRVVMEPRGSPNGSGRMTAVAIAV